MPGAFGTLLTFTKATPFSHFGVDFAPSVARRNAFLYAGAMSVTSVLAVVVQVIDILDGLSIPYHLGVSELLAKARAEASG